MYDLPIPTLMGLLGAFAGLVLGYVARRLRFCTLSAVESALYGDNWIQARMWALAIAVAVMATHLLASVQLIDLTQSFHLLPRLALAGPIIGGILFGMGMASVGTCGFGALLRAGGGDLGAGGAGERAGEGPATGAQDVAQITHHTFRQSGVDINQTLNIGQSVK